MCWQMFMFWFLKSITFENRRECKTEGKRLWVHTGCLEVMLQAVKATIQGESARAHRRVRAHVVKSAQSVREKLNHTAIQAGGQTEVTESWCRRVISDAVNLGNFKRVSSAGVTKGGSWAINAAMGTNYWVQEVHTSFFKEKKCVSLWIIMQCSFWNSFSQELHE